jgi:hypothetical protein
MPFIPSTGPFAERTVDLLKPTGERVSLRVEFGPIEAAGQDYRCQVRFEGWGDSPPAIWGYDSVQAFLLAVNLVHGILAAFVRQGGRVVWPGTLEDFDLAAWNTQFSMTREED